MLPDHNTVTPRRHTRLLFDKYTGRWEESVTVNKFTFVDEMKIAALTENNYKWVMHRGPGSTLSSGRKRFNRLVSLVTRIHILLKKRSALTIL